MSKHLAFPLAGFALVLVYAVVVFLRFPDHSAFAYATWFLFGLALVSPIVWTWVIAGRGFPDEMVKLLSRGFAVVGYFQALIALQLLSLKH